MSNLGLYQVITTMAGRVGGVRNLVGLIAAGGAAVGGLIAAPAAWVARGRYEKAKTAKAGRLTRGVLAAAISDSQSVTIEEGTHVTVLQTDDPEVVLVEEDGTDNPIALARDEVHLSEEE